MKKLVITAILATAALAAQAVEVGVTSVTNHGGANDTTGTGITIGQKFGAIGVTGGFEHFSTQHRYSLTADYGIAKFGPVTVTSKAGVAYLDNTTGASGSALVVGLGASMPITKQVSLTVDAVRQYGQDRVGALDGNRVSAGLKYRF